MDSGLGWARKPKRLPAYGTRVQGLRPDERPQRPEHLQSGVPASLAVRDKLGLWLSQLLAELQHLCLLGRPREITDCAPCILHKVEDALVREPNLSLLCVLLCKQLMLGGELKAMRPTRYSHSDVVASSAGALRTVVFCCLMPKEGAQKS